VSQGLPVGTGPARSDVRCSLRAQSWQRPASCCWLRRSPVLVPPGPSSASGGFTSRSAGAGVGGAAAVTLGPRGGISGVTTMIRPIRTPGAPRPRRLHQLRPPSPHGPRCARRRDETQRIDVDDMLADGQEARLFRPDAKGCVHARGLAAYQHTKMIVINVAEASKFGKPKRWDTATRSDSPPVRHPLPQPDGSAVCPVVAAAPSRGAGTPNRDGGAPQRAQPERGWR